MEIKADYPNVLLIAGAGRKVGKTLLACRLIEKYKSQKIIAIKIAPHFHPISDDDKVLVNTPNFNILEETKTGTGKNSARFLAAGAEQVYFIQALDDHVYEAFDSLMEIVGKDHLFIIESGGLRKFIKPGLFIYVDGNGNGKENPEIKSMAEEVVSYNGEHFDPDCNRIAVEDSFWVLV